jgi:hypothetical protein
MNTGYLLIQNGYADWEPASAPGRVATTFGFSVKTMGLNASEVVSMAALRLMPDLSLGGFVPDSGPILGFFPAATSGHRENFPKCHKGARGDCRNRPVAAICAATLALAHCGLLDGRLYTSNGCEFIGLSVKSDRGEEFCRPSLAARDRRVITAKGPAPFAAAEIFRELAQGEGRHRDL